MALSGWFAGKSVGGKRLGAVADILLGITGAQMVGATKRITKRKTVVASQNPHEGANRRGEGSIMRRTASKSLLLHRFIAESPVIEPMVEEWFRAAVQQMLKRI